MARGTRSRKNMSPPKMAQRTRAKTLNSKPSTPTRGRVQKNVAILPKKRNSSQPKKATNTLTKRASNTPKKVAINGTNTESAKSQQKTSKRLSSPSIRLPSPSVFDGDLMPMYLGLEFPQNSSTDSKLTGDAVDICQQQSSDLFSPEEEEIEEHCQQSSDLFPTEPTQPSTPVKMFSVGIQYSPVPTRDAAIGTEARSFKDCAIQTSPMLNERFAYDTNESDGWNSFSSLSDSCDSHSDVSSSSDSLRDFDMLDGLDDADPKADIVNDMTEDVVFDETKSRIESSPVRHQIYVNDQFHSPNSLRGHLQINSNWVNTKNGPIS